MSARIAAVLFWLLFGAASVLVGLAERKYADTGFLELLLVVAGAGLAFLWYRLDAREEGVLPSVWLDVMIIGATAAAVPYYLLRYKGWKRGGMALAKVMLAMAAVVAVALLAEQWMQP